MSVQSTRGRKVQPTKRNNLVILYGVIGLVVLVGLAALMIFLTRGDSGVQAPNAPVGRTAEGFYYKGNPDATVKVIAYEDFQCPACGFFVTRLAPIVDRDYVETGRVQFIYHELPLDIHPNAVPAAEAARCAGDQGKFWEMHDLLFVNQAIWSPIASPANTFSGYAGQIGIDRNTFNSCMSAATHQAAVAAAGQSALGGGVQATPTFSVNGQLVDSGGLLPAIDAALRAAGQ